jgi:hypothetical protein
VQGVDEIAAIIEDQVWLDIESCVEIAVVTIAIDSVVRKDIDSILVNESGSGVILS